MNKINVLRLSLPSVFSGSHLRLKEVEYFKTAAVKVESKPSLEIRRTANPPGVLRLNSVFFQGD
jgi:diacylglycerol kinase family enzyme